MPHQQTNNQHSNGDPQANNGGREVRPQTNKENKIVRHQTHKGNRIVRHQTHKGNRIVRPPSDNNVNIILNLAMTPEEPLFIKNNILNIIDIDYNNLSKKNGCDWCGAPHCDGC